MKLRSFVIQIILRSFVIQIRSFVMIFNIITNDAYLIHILDFNHPRSETSIRVLLVI